MEAKKTMETMSWWTASELKEAITRCEADCEAMIANGATPAALRSRRQGIDNLYHLLYKAERAEHGGNGNAVYYSYE